MTPRRRARKAFADCYGLDGHGAEPAQAGSTNWISRERQLQHYTSTRRRSRRRAVGDMPSSLFMAPADAACCVGSSLHARSVPSTILEKHATEGGVQGDRGAED